MGLWKLVSKQPELLSNSSGLMCHVRQNKLSSAVSQDEQQKYLVTKGPGFLRADLFFLLLLPQKHSKGPIRCQVGGRVPANTGPACPNTCLFCSAVVSIVLPAMLECPIIKGAKYCIAYYYFAHMMELQNTIIVKLEPGSNRIPLEGLFPGGQSASWSHSAVQIPRKSNF